MLLRVMLRLGFSVVSDAERYPGGSGITSGSMTPVSVSAVSHDTPVIIEDTGALVVKLDTHFSIIGQIPPKKTVVFEVEFLDYLLWNVRVTIIKSTSMQQFPLFAVSFGTVVGISHG